MCVCACVRASVCARVYMVLIDVRVCACVRASVCARVCMVLMCVRACVRACVLVTV